MTPLAQQLKASIEEVTRRNAMSAEPTEAPKLYEPEPPLAWVKLIHPRGIDVRLPIPVDGTPVSVQTYAAVLQSVSNACEAGWLTEMPGLEAGEHMEECGYVVKSMHDDGGERVTPMLDLYSPNDLVKFPLLRVYLNDDAAVDAFEFAAGCKLSAMPMYVGSGRIERGASRQMDAMVYKLPKPIKFVMKPNPKHNPDEKDVKKKKTKHLFVRWADSKPPAASPQAEQPKSAGDPANFPAYPGIEFPAWWETREFACKAADYKELPNVIDKLDNDRRESKNGDRLWFDWLLGYSLHKLLFHAERQADLAHAWACVNAIKPAGWLPTLTAYKEQRKTEVRA